MKKNAGQKMAGIPQKLKNKKKLLIWGCLLIILIGVGFFGMKTFFEPQNAEALQTAVVQRGDVSQTITGSGTLSPLESYNVISLVQGDIIADYINEGQTIAKGDLLYEISHEDMATSIEKSQLNLEKAQIAYKNILTDIANLTVKSAATGTISEIYVADGDNVSENSKLAKVVNNDTAVVSVAFLSSVASQFYVGQEANVFLEDTWSTLDGTITRIATGDRIAGDYVRVKDIEITLTNPGNVSSGQSCTVTINNLGTPYSGTIAYGEEEYITAKTSGKVGKLSYKVSDSIKNGDTFAELRNDSLETSKINSNLSLKEAQLSLSNLYDQLSNYNITSPISGIVLQKNSKTGDTLSSNSATTMAVIVDMSKMTFTINVDELDITSIEVGQKVEITADATPNVIYTGHVNNISLIGSSDSGVTTYPVEVALEDFGDLLPGMNVNATIVVNESTDTLIIPVSALNRGNTVLVQNSISGDAQNSENGEANRSSRGSVSGFANVSVEIGISNDDYVEVLTGLSEGDVVLLSQTATQAITRTQIQGGMMGGGVVTVTEGGGPPNRGGGPPGN